MYQGKRSLARSWWWCEFDKWSNWSWGSPLSSLLPLVPHCKPWKLLSNPEKTASARFFATQPMLFVFILLLSLPFPLFCLQKKVRPAVKCCNPDAVTTLLSANHQRHRLFFRGKKVGFFWWAQSSCHMRECRGKHTAAYDVWCKSPRWGLTSYYLERSRAPQCAFPAPGLFICNCQHDLVLSCLACFPFSWDHSLVSVTNPNPKVWTF